MASKKDLKKVSVKKINLAAQPVGFTFEGKLVGFAHRPYTQLDEKKGELIEKTMTSIIMEDEKGERFAAIADKGLQTALDDSLIKEGMYFRAVKLDKAQLSRGRTMNQYDIFASV